MELKRQYNSAGEVSRVTVGHTGLKPEQNFSHRLIEAGIAQGWITLTGDTLTMAADPEDLVYTVKRTPGYFCKSTGERIPISMMAWASPKRDVLAYREAQAWLSANGKAATDYEVGNDYRCVLSSTQHEKFRTVRSISGNLVAAHTIAGA